MRSVSCLFALSVRLVTPVRCWTRWTVSPDVPTTRATTPPPWSRRGASCMPRRWSTSPDETLSSTGAWGTCRRCAPPSTTPNGSTVKRRTDLSFSQPGGYHILPNFLISCVLQSLILSLCTRLAALPTSSWEKLQSKTTAGRWCSLAWRGSARTIWVDASFWRTPGPPSWRPGSTAHAQEKSPFTTTSCRAPFTYRNRTWSTASSPLMCE